MQFNIMAFLTVLFFSYSLYGDYKLYEQRKVESNATIVRLIEDGKTLDLKLTKAQEYIVASRKESSLTTIDDVMLKDLVRQCSVDIEKSRYFELEIVDTSFSKQFRNVGMAKVFIKKSKKYPYISFENKKTQKSLVNSLKKRECLQTEMKILKDYIEVYIVVKKDFK